MKNDQDAIVNQARALLAVGSPDAAIDLIRINGVPDSAAQYALLARCYFQRGAARGDLFASRFFAGRAMELGDASQDTRDIFDRSAPEKEGGGEAAPLFQEPMKPGLGGPADIRPEGVASPYPHSAVSLLKGRSGKAKDMAYLDKTIPCQRDCPAHTDIPGYINAISRGDFDKAYRINLRDNVFPGVLGRVCARPCEEACRHGWEGLGDSVSICFSKRAAADHSSAGAVTLEPWSPPTGKRVAVVGAGAAGLAAARNLALMGHAVTVYEQHETPGGMMVQGIPVFRLPREVVAGEVEQIARTGVTIVCNTRIGRDITLERLLEDFHAVVIAAGTLRANHLDLPGKALDGIRHGLDFLKQVHVEGAAPVGERVLVIGGGFTAMDCARTALRLQAGPAGCGEGRTGEVRVCYRRSVNEMLVTPGELEALEAEGIPIDFMVSPTAYAGEKGKVRAVRFIRTELGEPDASGRRRPVAIPGSEFEVAADTVLLATGQFPDTSWIDDQLAEQLVGKDGWLKDGDLPATAVPRLFVAGDFATGARTLIEAIGHGKECARSVDRLLTGRDRFPDSVRIDDAAETGRIREMDAVPQVAMPVLPLNERTLAAEVEQGFSCGQSREESQRCYLCHFKYEIDADKCIYCEWCLKAKPRPDCIVRAKHIEYDKAGRVTAVEEAATAGETRLIWINQEECIRCHACVNACPVDCISVQRVRREPPGGAADGKEHDHEHS